MARTRAPLLSWSASGAIADTQVYAEWKGRPYVRQYVVPANPNSVAQQATRGVFAWLNDLWRYMPAGAVGAWELYAKNSRFTARNGWIKQNLSNLRSQSDINNLILSPAAGGGIIAQSINVTPAANALTVEVEAPPLPTGWTITEAWAMAVPQQSPESGTDFEVVADSTDTAPYSIDLTGLGSSQDYQVGAWLVYQKADGRTAYGISFTTQATTS